MNPLRKVLRGEPRVHSAALHNQVVDAVRSSQSRARVNQITPGSVAPMPGLVRVRNASGSAAQRFQTLTLSEPVFGPDVPDEFENRVCFDIVNAPSQASTPPGYVAVTLVQPLADSAIGFAVIQGVTVAILTVVSAAHRFADVGLTGGFVDSFTSHTSGQAEILWKEAGTGVKWAVLRIGKRNPD